jgi:hypothetical protein
MKIMFICNYRLKGGFVKTFSAPFMAIPSKATYCPTIEKAAKRRPVRSLIGLIARYLSKIIFFVTDCSPWLNR